MTAPRPRPILRHDDERAVSSVLGAVLVFGLIVVTLTVIQVQFVPIWGEEREARHVELVNSQLAQVVSDLQRLASNQTSATLTDPLTLTRGGTLTFFGTSGQQGGSLSFTPDATAGVNFSSPQIRLHVRNGVQLQGLGADWINYDNSTNNIRENVTAIDFLRLRITNFTKIQTQTVYTGTLSVTSGGTTYARLMTVVSRTNSETSITVRVLDRNGTAVHESPESFANSAPINSTYINALSDDYLFAALIGQTPAPYTISFTTDAPTGIFDAQYMFSGQQATAGGGTQVIGNLGVVQSNFTTAVRSGSLAFALNNARLPSQTYVLEHGALLLVQDGAAVIRVPPALRVSTSGGQTQLAWTLAGLVGNSGGVSGADAASMTLAPSGGRNDLVGTADSIVLRFPTAYGAAWTSWLDGQLRNAGLSQALGHYTLSSTASTVTLALNGATTGSEDVYVSLLQSNVQIATTSSG